MKILVTGASGFIGKNIVKSLSAHDIFPVYKDHKIENGWCCDLTSMSATRHMLKKIQPDVIVHCAANPNPKHPECVIEMLNDNVLTTLNLLECAPEGSKFVFLSSIGVFGDFYPVAWPSSLYGATKLCSETLIMPYVGLKGIKRRVIRTCAVVGPETTHGLLFDIKRKLKSDSTELELFGDEPGTKKPFIHIDELCSYIKDKMIELPDEQFHEEELYEIMNAGPRDNASVKEIAEAVMDELKIHKPIKWLGSKAIWKGDNKELIYGPIFSQNHFTPQMSSLEAIRKAVQ